uniref:Uncharacterized protein n=1 Tax=Anguilla anguilla TaxID=7936 RepID=A0A0E9SLH8_ANGAN
MKFTKDTGSVSPFTMSVGTLLASWCPLLVSECQ